MSLYTNLVKHITYPIYLARYGRSTVMRHFRGLNRLRYDRSSAQEIRERQLKSLVRIVTYAFDHSQWYKTMYTQAGIRRSDLQDPAILPELPIIRRADLRENMGYILSDEYPRSELSPAKTGGSTMEPMLFYRDDTVYDYRIAFELFLNEAAGWKIGEPWVNFWGHLADIPNEETLKKLKYNVFNNLSRRMIACNATYMDDYKLAELTSEIQMRRPTWLFGYPRAIAEYARFLIREKLEIPPVRGVLVTAEPMPPADKESIINCFGVTPLDRYASREVGMVSQECEHHCGLHLMSDNVHVEYLPHDETSTDPNTPSRLVITDLHNTGMPLIRYETDDVANPLCDFGESTCGCKFSGLPLMSHVSGRVTDLFLREDGSWFTGLDVPGMRMAESGWVNQIQYIQTDINELTVNIVRGKNYHEGVLEYLHGQVSEVFRSDVTLHPVFVEAIPKTRSGKFMYSINKVPRETIERVLADTGRKAPDPTKTQRPQ